MDKSELIKETFKAIDSLYERVHNAGIASAFIEGRYYHEIAHGLVFPLAAASSFFEKIVKMLENPEIDRRYSVLRPFKRSIARKATEDAKMALEGVQSDNLQEIYDTAQVALESDLESSIVYYANALSKKQDQKMTDEDTAKMQPVMQVMKILKSYFELQEEYQPAL